MSMSQDCTATGGSLLTQQTVLGFSAHPPSPFGARQLPQFVSEAHGGQESFAMNRHTQLQFNLGIPPSPTNLATHFDPSHPRPVVIEKPSLFGGEEFKVLSAKKLALAVRLAKRDLKLGRVPPPSLSLCHTCRNEQTPHPQHHLPHRVEQATPQLRPNGAEREQDTSLWSSVLAHRSDPGMVPPQTLSKDTSLTEREQRDLSMRPPLHQQTGLEEVSVTAEECLVGDEGKLTEEDSSSKEVARLRKELQRQITYLKQLRELRRGNTMIARRDAVGKTKREKVSGEAGRVWMEEVKGEEERLARRKEERGVRNARTIYNLSLQVSSLQRDVQKTQILGVPSSGRKVQAARRLATIYRSSLRLLHNYQGTGHTPEPLPLELLLLLKQLSLLTHHFGVGGAKYELDAMTKTLQELIEEQEKENVVSRQPFEVSSAPQRTNTKKKGSQVRNGMKKTSLYLHPQLRSSKSARRERVGEGRRGAGQPHFAQQTMSSQKRQQKSQQRYLWQQQPWQPTHSPIKAPSSVLHSSTPLVLQGEGESERGEGERKRGEREKVLHQLLRKHHQESCITSPPTTPLRDDQEGTNSLPLAEPKAASESPREEKRIHVASLSDGEESGARSPRDEGQRRLWMDSVTATLAHHSKTLETFRKATEKQMSQLREDLTSKTKMEKREGERAGVVPKSVGKSSEAEGEVECAYDRERLEGLMERLRELEGEEEVIRERWRTVAYEDPPLSQPHVMYSSKDRLSEENVTSPAPAIPDEAQRRIDAYRQRFDHHLEMTGHSTKGGFNPWKMAENLADNLLYEIIDELANEFGELCDGYIDQIFSNEFAPPLPRPLKPVHCTIPC